MATNGNARNRKFSDSSKDSLQDSPYAQIKTRPPKPPTPPSPPQPPLINNPQGSPMDEDDVNPAPPIKIPTRAISAVESRLLSIATSDKPLEGKPLGQRRVSRAGSGSDNESPEKRSKGRRSPRRKSRSRSLSPAKKSPDRKRGRSPAKKRSPSKKSSAKKKSRSPVSRKRRSPSRSRSRSRSRRRRSSTRSPPRRKRSRSRDRKRSRSKSRDRRRSRSRSKDRKRSSSRSRKRSRSRSHGRKRSRSRDRKNGSKRKQSRSSSRSRSRSPKFTSKWGQKPSSGVCRAVVPANGEDKKGKEVTTEDVEKRLAEHMKKVQDEAAEAAKKINLPGYLNPAMVNVHQFKQVQDKKKLLWGKTKEEADAKGTKWAGAFDDSNNDDKFRRLMGIHGEGAAVVPGSVSGEGSTSKTVEQSRKVLDDLEKEYEKSRAFQLSRGAGGLTGMGLGFGSSVPQPPPQ